MNLITSMVTAFTVIVIVGACLVGFVWLVDHTPTWLFITITVGVVFALLTSQFYMSE